MKRLLMAAALVCAANSVSAQSHWVSAEECKTAIQSGQFLVYYPSSHNGRIDPTKEVVGGRGRGECIDMDLPEYAGGRGWVAIEPGRPLVFPKGFDVEMVRALRLAECGNKIYNEVPVDFPPNPIKGQDGAAGAQGPKGDPGPPGHSVNRRAHAQDPAPQLPPKKGMSKWTKLSIGVVAVAAGIGIGGCLAHYDGWCTDTQINNTNVVKIDPSGGGLTITQGSLAVRRLGFSFSF